ncbi:MAG: AsnC family transcriptional regulator [Promethearchaeota archaeon]|nr:MAG: AsnC family transcriptional regulator [Candidatus Lokiarchaeota archaeon]
MDEIDLIIIRKLLENSRLTFRELAEITTMSVSTIHKRIQSLIEDGIINAFIVRPTMISLKGLWIMASGASSAKSMDLVSQELGNHENINLVTIASGKYLYIGAYLRNIAELQEFTSFLTNTSQISDPTIGIINIPYMTTPETLSSIDYKILKTLNRDSRKPLTDIGEDVGISAKTVRRRLDRMIENRLAFFTIEWTPKSENNFITIFHIYLNEGTDMNSTVQHIYQKYAQNLVYCLTFSNIPNYITMHTWAKTSIDAQKIQEELQTEGFKDLIPRIILYGNYYDCWVDQLLRSK